jgi:hypothetical protein
MYERIKGKGFSFDALDKVSAFHALGVKIPDFPLLRETYLPGSVVFE